MYKNTGFAYSITPNINIYNQSNRRHHMQNGIHAKIFLNGLAIGLLASSAQSLTDDSKAAPAKVHVSAYATQTEDTETPGFAQRVGNGVRNFVLYPVRNPRKTVN